MRKQVHLLAISVSALLGCFAFCIVVGQSGETRYALPFGNQPYAPSRATADFPGFLTPSDFPSARYCSECHQDVHREWRESAHANSFRAPFYFKNVQMLIEEKGIEYTRHCEGCHNPIALFSGALTANSNVDRSFDGDGITCSVCHSITRIQNNVGIGSYVMGRPAVMVHSDGSPWEGLPTHDEILQNRELHKKAVMRDFMRTPQFCSVCHKAAIPSQLNSYKWLRAFSVYDEWQQSSWARQSALPFYKKEYVSTCQGCHMPLRSAGDAYGARAGKIASHRFPGANTAIPTYYSYPQQLQVVQEFLRNSLALDFFALTINHSGKVEQITPLGRKQFRTSPGDEVTVDLVVQNRGIGHTLVPEQRDFYESWVEFTARDESGTILFRSGALDKDGFLDPAVHSYTNRLIDSSGKLLVQHQVWNTRLKPYDNTIPPGRSDLARYGFRIPENARGTVTISAAVRYRRFRKQYTDFILATNAMYPVCELGSTDFQLRIGRNFPQRPRDEMPSLLRWNNYGIALLGQQQWWTAANAFSRTTQIDPGYVDGYVNQAIAEYSKWIESRKENPDGPGVLSLDNANAPSESFAPALELLEKALALKPGYARALFYKGVILRLQNRLDAAVQALQEVTRQFPAMRQGHQELGYVLYLKKSYAEASDQFEAVKLINPDDVTACYYLSITYARLGRSSEAQENAKLYAEHRDDPNNFALNLDFVQRHPDEARELTPYHVHKETR